MFVVKTKIYRRNFWLTCKIIYIPQRKDNNKKLRNANRLMAGSSGVIINVSDHFK